jgi:hypothetical protein
MTGEIFIVLSKVTENKGFKYEPLFVILGFLVKERG